MTTSGSAPFEHFYDLNDLSRAGDDVRVVADEAACARIAAWAEVISVSGFSANISLRKISPTRFTVEGTLNADVMQACVVTLEPVPAHIEREFTRELILRAGRHAALAESEAGGELTLAAGDDDVPEEITSSRYDLAAPLLEEFSLALDPYPRAPGVAFEAPKDEAAPESPFAVLKALKKS